ncbi:MAG TPA: UDP-N-acetylmuramoyl-L-alanyl-D-glutamate--2,6-diaminopimelate ligase [Candidatus Saccharimonadales bacterium]|jgi:UDP-N-acetylmuramyl-tripeptide synthetase
MKSRLKQLLPKSLIKPFLPAYHWLQALGANLRYGFPARGMKVVAVTGTNGKTTTAAYLAKIMEANGLKVGITTTAFSQIGTEITPNESNMTVTDPFRLFKMLRDFNNAKVDWVILEVTSHALSQSRTLFVPVKAAIITNLTQDHLDYHGSMEVYASAKGKLFRKKADIHVLNRDDEWFHYFDNFEPKHRVLTYGADVDADCRVTAAKLGPEGSAVTFKLERAAIKPKLKLAGKFNVYNALAAAAAAHGLDFAPETIESGLEGLDLVPGRMEMIKHKKRGLTVIVDYAHTPDALENVLETLKSTVRKRVIVVFGATGDRDASKRPLMGRTAARLADVIIVTDDDTYTENPISIRAEVLEGAKGVVDGAEIYEVGDRRAAISKAIELAKRGDTILLAGIGHQRYRVIAGQKQEWAEKNVAEELLAKAK